MHVFHMRKRSRYWLLGSIGIVIINLTFFIFRHHVQEAVLLWVVILTPVICLILYPLTCLLDKNNASRSEDSTG